MTLVPSARFKKHYRKLSRGVQLKVNQLLELFSADAFNPLLNNHPLHGAHRDKRTINVGGDYRIVFREVDESKYLLIDVGTHSELYR